MNISIVYRTLIYCITNKTKKIHEALCFIYSQKCLNYAEYFHGTLKEEKSTDILNQTFQLKS